MVFKIEVKSVAKSAKIDFGIHRTVKNTYPINQFDFYLLRPYLPFVPPLGFVGDPMNGLGDGVWQGRDMVLYNAFDREHLRQKFMQLPSAPRSSLDAEGKGSSKNMQKKMVTDLQNNIC